MIIGHKSIIHYLSNIIKHNNPSDAYLFYGPQNVGKQTVALWFAQGLTCQAKARKRPCGECLSCTSISKGVHPDILTLVKDDEDTLLSISDIRALQNKIFQTAFYNSYKIAILKRADRLSADAGHALLKLLEEPPKKTICILIAQTRDALLPTIRSRVEMIRFQLLKEEEIVPAIKAEYTDEQKIFVGRVCQGRIGAALTFRPEKMKARIEKGKIVLAALKKSFLHEKILLLEGMAKDGEELQSIMEEILRDMLLIGLKLPARIIHSYLIPEYQKIAPLYSASSLMYTLKMLLDFSKEEYKNVNRQLLWQNLLLNLR